LSPISPERGRSFCGGAPRETEQNNAWLLVFVVIRGTKEQGNEVWTSYDFPKVSGRAPRFNVKEAVMMMILDYR
jgi:hypothetical protein